MAKRRRPHDFTIRGEAKSLITSLKGRTLDALEAAHPGFDVYGAVRLRSGRGAIDVSCVPKSAQSKDGEWVRGFGAFKVRNGRGKGIENPSRVWDPWHYEIGSVVEGIILVNTHVRQWAYGELVLEYFYTQAIALALADGRFLILDKCDYQCDMVSVRFGDRDLDDLVFDDVDDCVGYESYEHLRWERTYEII